MTTDTTLPSLNQEYIAPAPVVMDNFVDTSLSHLNKKFPDLSDNERSLIQRSLSKIPNDSVIQQETTNIINQLILLSTTQDKNKVTNIIREISLDAKNGFEHTNTLFYTQNLLGAKQEQKVKVIKESKSEIAVETEKNTIKTEKNTVETEKNTIKTEKNTVEIKDKTLSEKIKATINNTDLSKVTIQYDRKELTSRPETKKALEVFKDALGYDHTPGEGLTGTELKKNDEIEQKAIKYINHNIVIGRKVRKARNDKSIKISEEEKRQSDEFIGYLKNNNIDPGSFFRSLGGDRKSFESKFDEKSVLNNNISSEKNSTSLTSNLGNNENINIDSLEVDNVFKDIDTSVLIKKFPLPKNMKEYDFQYTSGSSEGFLNRIQTLTTTRGTYPFLEQSTTDWKTLVVAKKRLALYFILKNNTTMDTVPEEILNTLYPSTGKDKDNWAERLRGKLLKKSRSELMGEYERELVIPLMKNNFLNPKIEQSFSKTIKKSYLSSISDLLSQTPELDQFSYNAKEIVMTNDLVKLPLYVKGQDTVDSYLTIEDGNVYISNALYNPTDSKNVTQVTKGKVRIGQVKDFATYAQDAVKKIPEHITTDSRETNPQLSYQERFRASTDNIDIVPTDENGYKESLQANIAHSLSQNKVRTSMKNVMYNRNSDGSMEKQDTKKSSPFYRDLENYEESQDKTMTKENSPDTFDVAAMIRTNMLRNSDSENIILKDTLAKFSSILTDRDFNNRVSIYLNDPNSDKESPKYALFSLLDPDKRKKSDTDSKKALVQLLQLFGTTLVTGPAAQNKRIDTKRFQGAVDGLSSGVSLDLMNTDNLIASNNPLIEKINKQNGGIEGSFDQQFDSAYA